MITIKNRVTKIKVNRRELRRAIQKILDVAGYPDFDIGVWLTTNKTIRVYNKKYRKQDKPTDVLSFPYHDKLKPGQKIVVKSPEDKNLGDILISLEYIKKDDLYRILVHGVAHLLGYDHQTEKAYKIMQKKEQQLLAALQLC